MRICSTCSKEKNESEFFFRNKSKGRLHYTCKECMKPAMQRWYQQNRDMVLARSAASNLRYIRRNRAFILAWLQEHPCVDCGESDPVVLDFDHRSGEDKSGAISELVSSSYSIARLRLEIEKCDVRCANCHRRRTAQQFGWWYLDAMVVTPDVVADDNSACSAAR